MSHLVSLLIFSLFIPSFFAVCTLGELDVGAGCIACGASSATNCLACSTTLGICDQPFDGFYVSATGTTLTSCNTANCKYCPNNICQTCKANSLLSAGSCVGCDSTAAHKCDSCPIAGTCAICKYTFEFTEKKICECPLGKLENAGACVACGPNSANKCLVCTIRGVCNQPLDGYYVSSDGTTLSQCTPLGNNCKYCPNNVCQTCMATFLLSAGSCVACSSTAAHKCQICTTAGICDTCQDTFVMNTKQNLCVCPANQLVYVTSGKCVDCGFLSLTNCFSCPAGNICVQANVGYYLNTANIVTSCSTLTECISCSSGSKCDVCNPKFFANAGVCTDCTPNCKTCTSASTTACTSCDNNYILESGACVQCPSATTKCSACSTGGMCTACQDNYVAVNGYCVQCPSNSLKVSELSCVACGSSAPSHNCLSCPSSLSCLEAIDGYYIDVTGKAVKCSLSNCKKCSSSTVCTLCNTGFLVKFDNTCGACLASEAISTHKCSACPTIGKCDSCVDSYFVNSNNVCAACDTNAHCKTCLGPSSNQCLSCIDLYILESGSCVFCVINSANTKCNSCATLGACTDCQTGYIVQVGKCVQCSAGYMEANKGCVKCEDPSATNCLDCPSGNTCTKPALQFYVDATGRTSNCIENCQVCTGNTGCSLCNPTYLLKNSDNTCELCNSFSSAKCSLCTIAGECTTCFDGYFLDKDFKCAQCQTHCKTCTKNTANSCQSCDDAYILESGECVLCSPLEPKTKCKTCTGGGICDFCQDNYRLQGIVCVACPTGCKTCSSTTVCTVCNSGYMLSDSSCYLCEPGSSHLTTHCEVCSVANVCTQCASGYYIPLLATQCALCTTNCLQCSSNPGCEKCANGYILNTNLCVLCNSESISKCINCPSDGKCTECAVGYYIDSSSSICFTCSSNCLTCSNSKTNCQSCDNGYILEGSSCQKCEPVSITTKCASCLTNGKCTQCQVGNYVNEFSNCSPCAPNCKTCSSSAINQCITCFNSYTLEEGECIKCEVNSIKTKCVICAIGDKCTTCALTYFPNTNNRCEACSPNCKECTTAANDACTSCNNEYILVTNSCFKCSITSSTSNGCATCPIDGKCTSCQETYYLINDACSPCISNCQRCNDGTTCSLCKSGFTLTTPDNKCATNIPNCNIILGTDITKCSSCNFAYGFTEDSLCAPEIPYCTTIDKGTTSECKTCNEGYGFNLKKTCEKCTPSCKACSDSFETCTLCSDGYYLIYDVCLSCDSSCATCTDGQTCTKCANGYYMEDTKCVKCGSEGSQCQTCVINGVCSLCSSGYFYVSATNKCTACSTGCATCASSSLSQCAGCIDGYLFNSAAKTCSKCTEPCKTCQTSLTTCVTCPNNYVIASSVCKIADCSTVTSKPYVLINDYSCNACSLVGFKTINSTHCVQISDPVVKINILEDGNVKASVNCLKGNNIFYSYGIAKSALIDVPTIKSQIATPLEDLLDFLVVGRLTNNPSDQNYEWILTGLKQTGENYVFRAYCELNDYVTSPVDVNFITVNNTKAESLILYVKTNKVLTATTKTTVVQAITTVLSTTKTLLTEDDANVVQTSTINNLYESNVYKFTFLPDYSLVNVDPYLNAMKAYILKNQKEFAAKLNNSLADIGINAIVVSNFQTTAPVPVILSKNSTVNYSSIVVNWKQNTPGRVTVFYKKNEKVVITEKNLNFNLTDAEYLTLSNDAASLVQYKFQVPANEEVPLLVYSLTANTTYRFYYYGENDAIPKRRTPVMGEILTTLNQTINGLQVMKFCLIAIVSLWIAVLI